jgi:hypothetical protein
MDHLELARRRAAKKELGWDECNATGEDHSPDEKPQPDGKHYCKYCGAEMLPEDMQDGAALAKEAFDAVERYNDWAHVNEANWSGWGEQTIPAGAEWWRVKSGQALSALRECLK